jgi:hypothetical protein
MGEFSRIEYVDTGYGDTELSPKTVRRQAMRLFPAASTA